MTQGQGLGNTKSTAEPERAGDLVPQGGSGARAFGRKSMMSGSNLRYRWQPKSVNGSKMAKPQPTQATAGSFSGLPLQSCAEIFSEANGMVTKTSGPFPRALPRGRQVRRATWRRQSRERSERCTGEDAGKNLGSGRDTVSGFWVDSLGRSAFAFGKFAETQVFPSIFCVPPHGF